MSHMPEGSIPVQFDPSAFVADSELVEALEQRSLPCPFVKDHVLFRQGDPPTGLYLLHAGQVTLSMDGARGDEVMTVKTGAGSLLGLPGLLANQPYTMSARAHEGAEVRYISRAEFTAFMQSAPQFALKILEVLAAEVRTARRALY